MLSYLKNIITKFFDKELSFRIRVFNVIGLTGVIVSIASAVNAAFSNNPVLVFASAAAAVVAVIMMYIFTFTKYRLPIKIITVTVIFCTVFPMIFFEVGDYGMIIFVLGILFSSVLFEKRKNAILICLALLLYYSVIIVIEHIPPFSNDKPDFAEIRMQIMTFILNSGAIAITVIWLIDAYERQAEKLQIMNKNKIEFLSNFSHELKTPLTSISGYAQFGENIIKTTENFTEKDINQIRNSFAKISRSASYLDRMSTQLLEITMIEQGVVVINPAPCVFRDIAERIRGQFDTLSNDSENTLEVLEIGDLPIINTDPDKVIQVLFNLIKNANRHTKNGVVTLSAKREDDRVIITVADTGSGIPNELIPLLFKKYPQTIIGEIKTEHGIGLYICKTYINAMGGEISLSKTSEAGSEFLFSLPIK
ncbi:MAG: HAMP domain-containing histidine kinase [Ruminococcus sp.]|jgi:signal transduction histidine kinase|nr:HAMP domain-containing histidine kinase [Ruminococcus sp.]